MSLTDIVGCNPATLSPRCSSAAVARDVAGATALPVAGNSAAVTDKFGFPVVDYLASGDDAVGVESAAVVGWVEQYFSD